jgi:hypothetical protein
MRHFILGLVFLGALGLLGCSGKSQPTTTAGAQTPTDGAAMASPKQVTQPIAVPANAPPDQVVMVFLNALRSGDSPTTESLLTVTAKAELAKHNLSVDVQSAPSATYEVKPAEIIPNNPHGAHVSSIWTEKFQDGTSEPYEIVWVLRHQPEGWRLAGMAMQLLPGQPPQFLDFENPADMLRKKDEAIAALQPVAQTAQQIQAAPARTSPAVER